MYEPKSCNKIKILVVESKTNLAPLLSNHIFTEVPKKNIFDWTICTHETSDIIYQNYNLIFFIVTFENLENNKTLEKIKDIVSILKKNLNYLYIIIDGDNKIKFNDQKISFIGRTKKEAYFKFKNTLGIPLHSKVHNTTLISIQMATIWYFIIDANFTVTDLSNSDLDVLIEKYKFNVSSEIKKKRKNVNTLLEEIDCDTELSLTGYDNLQDLIVKFLDKSKQKQFILNNYLEVFEQINFDINNICWLRKIIIILNEIYEYGLIDMMDKIIYKKINSILINMQKINLDTLAIEPIQTCKIDAREYYTLFYEIKKNHKKYNLTDFLDDINIFLEKISNLIINFYNQTKSDNLYTIVTVIQILLERDPNEVNHHLDIIVANTGIITSNIDRSDLWVSLIDILIHYNISSDIILLFIEKIILSKITYYSSLERCNNKEYTVIYPHCLNVFLLSNISHHFIFKKIYMYASYNLRYSGRFLSENLTNVTEEIFLQLLRLEYKLLEICKQD